MKYLIPILIMVISVLSSNLKAATLSNLNLKQLARTEQGLFLRFTTTPSACSSNYKGFHALIPNTQENFNSLYLSLMRAKSTKQKVRITFTDRGNCNTAGSTLLISAIGDN